MKSKNEEVRTMKTKSATGWSAEHRSALVLGIFLPALCLLPSAFGQTNQPTAAASAVMVNSNGIVIAPTNFAAANGFGTNGGAGGGVPTNLAPGKIYVGNALSNAAAVR